MTKSKRGKGGGNEILYIAIGVAVGYFGKPMIDQLVGQIKGAIPSFSGIARQVTPRDRFEYSDESKRYEYIHPY